MHLFIITILNLVNYQPHPCFKPSRRGVCTGFDLWQKCVPLSSEVMKDVGETINLYNPFYPRVYCWAQPPSPPPVYNPYHQAPLSYSMYSECIFEVYLLMSRILLLNFPVEATFLLYLSIYYTAAYGFLRVWRWFHNFAWSALNRMPPPPKWGFRGGINIKFTS